MDLKVLDPRGFRYGGKHYKQSEVIPDARPREANLLVALGKAEVTKRRSSRKPKTDYQTRDMKAE